MANSSTGPGGLGCLTTTTTNYNGPACTNPIEWLFGKFTETIGKGTNKTNAQDAVDRILDKGIVMPDCDFCCPCPDGTYVLASVETFLKWAEAVAPIEVPGRCCNEFSPAIEGFLDCHGQSAEGWDRLLDKGIVEWGLIENNSQLPYIFQWIDQILISGGAGSVSASEIIDRIIDKGIVIYCNEETGEIVIASVETYLKYAEAADSGGGETCCNNVFASVETYLKYLEAVNGVPA